MIALGKKCGTAVMASSEDVVHGVSLLMSAPLSSPRAEFLSFTTNHIPVERTRKTEKNTQMADSGGKSRIIPLHPLVFTGSHKSQFVLSQRR